MNENNNKNTDNFLPKKKSRSTSKNSKTSSQAKSKSTKKDQTKRRSKSTSKRSAKSGRKCKQKQLPDQQSIDQLKIGFIGAGKMTESIVNGLLRPNSGPFGLAPLLRPEQLFVAAKSGRNLASFDARSIATTRRPYDIVGRFDCDLVFLAVHGCVVRACYGGGGSRPAALLVNYLPKQAHPLTVLSLVGGISLAQLRATLVDPEDPEKYLLLLFRACFNTAVQYGLGVGAIDCVDLEGGGEDNAGKSFSLLPPVILQLLQPALTARLEFCPEPLMDAFCALTGNGLAFVFYLISALASGGALMGLNKVMAVKLATWSLQSAAQTVLLECEKKSGGGGVHPSELQDRVTSEGGAASYGLQLLEERGVAAGLQSALEATLGRIRQLATTVDSLGQMVEVAKVKAPSFNV